jgi:hypothetical protein
MDSIRNDAVTAISLWCEECNRAHEFSLENLIDMALIGHAPELLRDIANQLTALSVILAAGGPISAKISESQAT